MIWKVANASRGSNTLCRALGNTVQVDVGVQKGNELCCGSKFVCSCPHFALRRFCTGSNSGGESEEPFYGSSSRLKPPTFASVHLVFRSTTECAQRNRVRRSAQRVLHCELQIRRYAPAQGSATRHLWASDQVVRPCTGFSYEASDFSCVAGDEPHLRLPFCWLVEP